MHTSNTLTKGQLRELETELHAERARLERSLSDQGSSESWASADPGTGAGGTGTVAGLQTQTDARYDAIVAALARFAAGSYGTCVGCQQPIPYGRLIVMPEVTHCVGCPPRM